MGGQKTALGGGARSTAADQIIAALHHAIELGELDIAKRLLAALENMLARRKADGHKEVEKLYVEIAMAKVALTNAPDVEKRLL